VETGHERGRGRALAQTFSARIGASIRNVQRYGRTETVATFLMESKKDDQLA
jgi:hypothetical protein